MIYSVKVAIKMPWKEKYTVFRSLLVLIIIICILTVLFAMIDLKIIYNYSGNISEDPFWFRILVCICEFGIWYGVYMTTFLVSYTYFQASLQLRQQLKEANLLEPDKADSLMMRLSPTAYLRIFVCCALLIGILTLVHSIFLIYLYYHFDTA
jgi:hypothetical protein